jgi:drug/metabolite transporter superfamily protein YnfA
MLTQYSLARYRTYAAQGGIPMAFILPRPGYFVKQRFLKRFRHCGQALVRIRYLIIINNWNGRSAREIEKALKIHNTTEHDVSPK